MYHPKSIRLNPKLIMKAYKALMLKQTPLLFSSPLGLSRSIPQNSGADFYKHKELPC